MKKILKDLSGKGDVYDGNAWKNEAAFLEAIQKAYLARNKSYFYKRITFAPSTLGYNHGNCPRYWVLGFEGGTVIEKNEAKGFANMSNGISAHTRLQKLFGEAFEVISEEQECRSEDPPIKGFSDNVIKWQGKDMVVELKTARQEVWTFRQANNDASPSHLLQTLLYMWILGIDYGVVVYENKNDESMMKPIFIKMDKVNTAYLNSVLDWMRWVRSLYLKDVMPKRPFNKGNKICETCPLLEECDKADVGTLDVRKNKLDLKALLKEAKKSR